MNENDHSAGSGSEHTGARRRRRPRRRVNRPAGSLAVSFSDGTFSDATTSAPSHSPAGAEGRPEPRHSTTGAEGHTEPAAEASETPVAAPEFQPAGAEGASRPAAGTGRNATAESAAATGRNATAESAAATGRNATAESAANDNSGDPDQSSPREELESALHDLPSKEEAPFAAVSVSTSGIHPKTSRLVALSVVFFGPGTAPSAAEAGEGTPASADEAGENTPASAAEVGDLPTINIGAEVGALTRHLNPGEDAGPWHLHGYQVNELSQALGFNTSAQLIHRALDGRTLIMHEADYVWGFLTHEFKLSQRSANRGRRSRGRSRGGRRVPLPAPMSIIDTLATARRQAINSTDPRLRAIVAGYNRAADTTADTTANTTADDSATGADASANAGRSAVQAPAAALPEVGAVASLSKKEIDPDELLEANARLTAALALAQQRSGELTVLDPEDLAADQFGLRRSALRIDAADSPRPYVNPGVWKSGEPLVEGMEFVVSPDVAIDPDVLIGQGVAAGLAYSEKLNRRSSLVVCNENYELRGKAMHADRKSIPLIRDEDFLALLDDVQPGERAATPTKPGADVRPRTSGLAGPRGGSGSGGSGSGGSGSSGRGSGSGGSGSSGRGSGSGGSGSSGRGSGGSGSGKSGKSKKSNKNGRSNNSNNSGHKSNANSGSSGRSNNSGHKGNANSGGRQGQIPGPSGKRNRRRRRRRKSSGTPGGSGSSRGSGGSGGSGGSANGGN
ncbi:DNA polymerase III subunit epsilon [Corynebacterium sp. YSMAA1_1_F7]|uniref:DNA polymerase III subunit epsilon n=1 Tax=Corynebacterium sp. YSMAA1_1_F7 TaxID=3383590 RepID=UPI0038D1E31C